MITDRIMNSGFNAAGRIGLVLLVVGLMLFNYFVIGDSAPPQDEPLTPVWLFLACQLLFAFICMFALVGWFFLFVFIMFVWWTIAGSLPHNFDKTLEYPKTGFIFVIKFLVGDWDRRALFRKE